MTAWMRVSRTTRLRVYLNAALGIALLTCVGAARAASTDGDGDGVLDSADNCLILANANQRDTNGDGYGNACDPDFNGNGIVDSQDGALLKARFGSSAYPDQDLNGNGIVDSQDGARLKARFGQPPGPKGTAPANRPPVISGLPSTTVVVGSPYVFTPTAADPEGQTLTFSVRGAPTWAIFSSATGTLSGTPTLGNVGLVQGIVITVSDGTNSASMPAFALAVVQVALGTATLSWVPPSQRADGSVLTTLAGYRIRFGTSPALLNQTIELRNPGLSRYVVEGLTPGMWYFGLVAFDSAGTTSVLSAIVAKSIP